MDNNLHLPLATLSHLIRTGDISSAELIESTFAEIDRRNPHLNAFITLFREQSLEAAGQAEKEIRDGRVRGTLHGIPIALKGHYPRWRHAYHMRIKILCDRSVPTGRDCHFEIERRGRR